MPTVVSFHAHPDDEVLLTGGTLARAAAQGHRVVLVFATDGSAGLADGIGPGHALAEVRRAETFAAAAALGAADVEFLGYADSGMHGEVGGATFARTPVDAAAQRLAAILRAESADVLTTYDAMGGYGHPDHRQVHAVGARAAELAGTPVVLEATVDRDTLVRAGRLLRLLPGLPADFRADRLRTGYAPRAAITHRIDVRAHAAAKRLAMAAHASQSRSGVGTSARTLGIFLRLPAPLFRWVFGHEWFVEQGRAPVFPAAADIFDSVRTAA